MISTPPTARSLPLRSERIPSLDGLRAVAILMVLLAHGSYSLPVGIRFLGRIGSGGLGVSIFFVLSGFLIHNLSARERQRTGAFDWRYFYARRALRILPCFCCFLAVLVVLEAAGMVSLSWRMLASAATFNLNYFGTWNRSSVGNEDSFVLAHYWTLALEEQFYLTWPLLMLLFARRKLFPVLVACMALSPVIRLATYFFVPAWRALIPFMFHTKLDAVAGGVLLGEFWRRPRCRARLERIAANRFALAGTLLFLFAGSPMLETYFWGVYRIAFGESLIVACIWILVTAVVSFPESFLFHLLNWRPVVYVGVLSYSLYVWNNLFLNDTGHWRTNLFPFNYLCVGGLALASHRLVEQPFLRLKNRFHGTEPVASAAIAVAPPAA